MQISCWVFDSRRKREKSGVLGCHEHNEGLWGSYRRDRENFKHKTVMNSIYTEIKYTMCPLKVFRNVTA